MYMFYVDESGTLDPEVAKQKTDGSVIEKEWLYCLTAFGLFEHKWIHFYSPIIQRKRRLIDDIFKKYSIRLELSECEVKSTWIRIPKERAKHPFLSRLSDDERDSLIETYYLTLDQLPVRMFAVIIDKRHLTSYMDRQKLHRKAWELLCERIENFMREYHPKHKAILIADDISKQDNISLTMKHAYFLEQGTSSGLRFKNIIETPFFVRSELSEGVQFADLCSYNTYKVFRHSIVEYPFFQRMLPKMYFSQNTHDDKIDGIKIFPPDSQLHEHLLLIQKKMPLTSRGM